jgi:predicted lysophospholipase L1 biosynthesis ABC-type transport system permease subunit
LHIAVFLFGGVVVGLFGIYLNWGVTPSRRYSVQLSALLGTAYSLGFILAALLIPFYGGSLLSADTEPNPSLSPASFPQAVGAATLFLVCLYFARIRRTSAGN